MQRQRHTLLSLAVCAALGGALPAVYAQTTAPDTRSDKQSAPSTRDQSHARPEARGNTQGAEQDRFLWDRNEYRDRQDLARNDHDSWRYASDRHDGWKDRDGWNRRGDLRGDYRDLREDRGEIRGDARDIQKDRADLERDLADRAANRDQLKVALGTHDTNGIAWERGQIRENDREILQDRRELRGDYRELRGDRHDLRADLRDHDRDVRHVDFRHDGDRHDFRHDRDHRDFGRDRHDDRKVEASMKSDTKVAAAK